MQRISTSLVIDRDPHASSTANWICRLFAESDYDTLVQLPISLVSPYLFCRVRMKRYMTCAGKTDAQIEKAIQCMPRILHYMNCARRRDNSRLLYEIYVHLQAANQLGEIDIDLSDLCLDSVRELLEETNEPITLRAYKTNHSQTTLCSYARLPKSIRLEQVVQIAHPAYIRRAFEQTTVILPNHDQSRKKPVIDSHIKYATMCACIDELYKHIDVIQYCTVPPKAYLYAAMKSI